MNYEFDLREYTNRVAAWTSMRRRVPAVTGVTFDKRYAGTTTGAWRE